MGRAALKVDCPNSSGGGKRGSSPCRKFSKKPTFEDDEDGCCLSSDIPNCFGFVAYSVNSGEKARVRTKSYQPAYCCGPPPECFGSPSPSPSLRKYRCLDQRDTEIEDKQETSPKKPKGKEGNPNISDSLWLG